MINFNEAPFLGNELEYITDAINLKHISGDGKYTKLCHQLLEEHTGTQKALLTNSGTAALEMSAMLLDIEDGDEIICPSFTFVTTASSFALRGAKIRFIDIRNDTLNMDETLLEENISSKTKAIIPVHYAGIPCAMNAIIDIANHFKIPVIEDAAQAVGSFYHAQPCGSIGTMGCFSFHETKNISSGEGGALLVNDSSYIENAEIIREKGTNRSKFFRGQIDKYTWVRLGSSYLPSDMIAAYLYPQLQNINSINQKRIEIWNYYDQAFKSLEFKGLIQCPFVPEYAKHNAHMYYLRFANLATRSAFIAYMKSHDISCVFHYIPLHSSPAGQKYGSASDNMHVTNHVSDTLVRLPMYYGMSLSDQDKIIDHVIKFVRSL